MSLARGVSLLPLTSLKRHQGYQLCSTAVALGGLETVLSGDEALVDIGGRVEDDLLGGVEWVELLLVHTTGCAS